MNGTKDDNGLPDDHKETLEEQHKQDPEAFKDKMGIDPDKPYEPIPGNPADGAN